MRNGNLMALLLCAGCRIGEHIADAPIDGAAAQDPDAAGEDAGVDAQNMFHGLHAIIGERPEVTGSCNALDDRAEMEGRFDPPVQEQDITAGWEFDTGADSYDDPSYGFTPSWPEAAQSGRFSVRYTGTIDLPPGNHCFSIDIGATGTGIIDGKNMCAQLYVGSGNAIAETGYQATTAGVAEGCVDVTGPTAFDIVFWYFNILEQAKLVVRVDDAPLSLASLAP
jgi:hypothetical protein